MTLPEIIQLGGTAGLIGVLWLAAKHQTDRLADVQREQAALLRECIDVMREVRDALAGCRSRQEQNETRHFRQPKP